MAETLLARMSRALTFSAAATPPAGLRPPENENLPALYVGGGLGGLATGATLAPFFNLLGSQAWSNLGEEAVLAAAGVRRSDLARLYADGQIGTALDNRRDTALSIPFNLIGPESRNKDFVWEQLERIGLRALEQAWRAIPMGMSVQAATWGRDERNRAIITDTLLCADGAFQCDLFGRLYNTATSQEAGAEDGPDGVDKARFFRYLVSRREGTAQTPNGVPLLCRLWGPAQLRAIGWKGWARFLDRHGSPIYTGSSATPAALGAALLAAGLDNVIGGVEDKIEAKFQSSTSAFADYERRITEEIQTVVLGQAGTTQLTGTGSRAALQVMAGVAADRVNADRRKTLEPAGQWIVNALCWANNLTGQPPRFVLAEPQGINKDLADRDAVLAQSLGVRFTPDYVANNYGIDKKDIAAVHAPVGAAGSGGQGGGDPPGDPANNPGA